MNVIIQSPQEYTKFQDVVLFLSTKKRKGRKVERVIEVRCDNSIPILQVVMTQQEVQQLMRDLNTIAW